MEDDFERCGYEINENSLIKGHRKERSASNPLDLVFVAKEKDGEKRDVIFKILGHRPMGPRYPTEISLHSTIKHPFIMSADRIVSHAVCSLTGLGMIYPLMKNKDLENFLRENGTKKYKTYEDSLNHISQAAISVKFLHSKGFCHNDLKPGNFLIDDDENLILTDFGSAMQIKKNSRIVISEKRFVTLGIAPPGIITNKTGDPVKYGFHVDVFELGVVFFFLLTGTYLYTPVGEIVDGKREKLSHRKRAQMLEDFYKRNNTKSILKKLIIAAFNNTNRKFKIGNDLRRPENKEIMESLADLISGMLVSKRQNRMTMDEVLKHPSIRYYVEENMKKTEGSHIVGMIPNKIKENRGAERYVYTLTNYMYQENPDFDVDVLFLAVDIFYRCYDELISVGENKKMTSRIRHAAIFVCAWIAYKITTFRMNKDLFNSLVNMSRRRRDYFYMLEETIYLILKGNVVSYGFHSFLESPNQYIDVLEEGYLYDREKFLTADFDKIKAQVEEYDDFPKRGFVKMREVFEEDGSESESESESE